MVQLRNQLSQVAFSCILGLQENIIQLFQFDRIEFFVLMLFCNQEILIFYDPQPFPEGCIVCIENRQQLLRRDSLFAEESCLNENVILLSNILILMLIKLGNYGVIPFPTNQFLI